MKKILVPLFSAIIIGLILGKYFFSQYEGKVDAVFESDKTIYVLQQGVYSNMDNVKKYTTKLDNYIVEEDGKYFRVYAAITSDKNNVTRLKEYFMSKGNDIYVRELKTNNKKFLELLEQYDLLLESGSGDNELIQIEKQVIDKYKELILKSD